MGSEPSVYRILLLQWPLQIQALNPPGADAVVGTSVKDELSRFPLPPELPVKRRCLDRSEGTLATLSGAVGNSVYGACQRRVNWSPR